MTTCALFLPGVAIQALDSSTAAFLRDLPYWAYPAAFAGIIALVLLAKKLRALPSDFRARNTSTLDPIQLEELMLGSPPQIVDLRPREEYEGPKGHIRGAMCLPFPEFQDRLGELDVSHPRPIVLVDETDALSHQALPLLEKQGHRWLYVLRGGFRAWRAARLPVYHVESKD